MLPREYVIVVHVHSAVNNYNESREWETNVNVSF